MAKTLVIKGANYATNKIEKVSFDENVPCTAIALNHNTLDGDALGVIGTLVATVTPVDTTDEITWSTSDSTVATVSDGTVTFIKMGTATITATCGEQTATCTVAVESIVPDYVVSGGFNARKATGGVLNGNTTTATSEGKNGLLAANNSNTSVKTLDRNGGSEAEQESNFRFVPIPIPAGAKRIKIDSNFVIGSTTIAFQTRFLWMDSTQSESGYVGAKCLDGKSGENNWDQDTGVTTITVDIPDNITGLDSFACSLRFADYVVAYNVDYTDKMDVTFLPAAE